MRANCGGREIGEEATRRDVHAGTGRVFACIRCATSIGGSPITAATRRQAPAFHTRSVSRAASRAEGFANRVQC